MMLIFGCGFLGGRVAELALADGERVVAVTRSAERGERLRALGIEPIVADLRRPETLRDLPRDDTILFAVGFDRTPGDSIEDVYVTGVRNVLQAVPPPKRFIYVSTTGVYGEQQGGDADESTPMEPRTPGAIAHLAAEQMLAASAFGPNTIVLRMAGLYGPGRIPRRRELLAGEPIAADANGLVNLIHVDDAAAAVRLAQQRAKPPASYVVSDGNPLPRGEYLHLLAEQLGAPSPRIVAPPTGIATRGGASKRIVPDRIEHELGFTCHYPTFAAGLAASLTPGP